jgi:hypothetical protein
MTFNTKPEFENATIDLYCCFRQNLKTKEPKAFNQYLALGSFCINPNRPNISDDLSGLVPGFQSGKVMNLS